MCVGAHNAYIILEINRRITSQYLTNLMHTICFTISFISCLYMFRAHVLIIRRSKLHYTASGIITLKQVSGLKLLKYNSINMIHRSKIYVWIFRVWLLCIAYCKHVMSCWCYVYPVKLIKKVLCLFVDRGSTVVKVLCYKSEGRWFDPSWCNLNFSLT